MKLKHNKSQGMSLEFLLGLIFTAVLILLVYSVYNNFIKFDSDSRDLIESWANDINTLEEGVYSQLLPLSTTDSKIGVRIFMISLEDKKKISEYYPMGDECTSGACICAYDLYYDKYVYCKSLKKQFSNVKIGSKYQKKFFTLVSDPIWTKGNHLVERYYADEINSVKLLGDVLIFDGDFRLEPTPEEVVEAEKMCEDKDAESRLGYCVAADLRS